MLRIVEPEREDRRHSDTDCDDVDDRPDLSREMHSNDRVIYRGRDAQNPDPALMTLIERLESEVGEDAAADPTEEDVVPIWVLGVESPEQHQTNYELRNPDSPHSSAFQTFRKGHGSNPAPERHDR